MSEYTEQAENFLSSHNLTFRAVFIGEDCPKFCEDAQKGIELVPGTFPRKNHIHGSHWRLTIAGEGRGHLTVDFWDSYNDAEIRWTASHVNQARDIYIGRYGSSFTLYDKHKTAIEADRKQLPTAYDMLASIQNHEVGTFEDFCGNFGYDEDSRRAESVYRAVVKEWRMVSKFFTAEELAEAQEIC